MTLTLLGLPLMAYNCIKIAIGKNHYTQEATNALIIAQLQKLPLTDNAETLAKQ